VCYDEHVTEHAERTNEARAGQSEPTSEQRFDQAKWPLVVAAVGIASGLAIAGSVERTAGGALVLGAWALGVAALHRLGRAGSVRR